MLAHSRANAGSQYVVRADKTPERDLIHEHIPRHIQPFKRLAAVPARCGEFLYPHHQPDRSGAARLLTSW